MKNWARTRAAIKRGPNWKATCSVCGKGIANRMKYDTGAHLGATYAHAACAKKAKAIGEWEDCW